LCYSLFYSSFMHGALHIYARVRGIALLIFPCFLAAADSARAFRAADRSFIKHCLRYAEDRRERSRCRCVNIFALKISPGKHPEPPHALKRAARRIARRLDLSVRVSTDNETSERHATECKTLSLPVGVGEERKRGRATYNEERDPREANYLFPQFH